ncbi:hypothetical protein BN000_01102 [Mycobacterium europaeum]|uniref:Uncharacterized protein n=1 Tax=Mycobacterium europaeum TaxID=761804 RepID=A0A0U1D226_9MYCO|nr:hypothetical protein BN000_01102 [Mycobacterium europaeum]
MKRSQANNAIAALGGAAALTVLVGYGVDTPVGLAPAAPATPTSSSPSTPQTSPARVPDSGCVSGANC